jgi:hypothetical protein
MFRRIRTGASARGENNIVGERDLLLRALRPEFTDAQRALMH